MSSSKLCPHNGSLKAAFVEKYHPWQTECGLTGRWEHCQRPGVAREILREFTNTINCALEINKYPFYGEYEQDNLGNFNGFLDLMKNGSLDLAVVPVAATFDRTKVFKYTSTYHQWKIRLFTKSSPKSNFNFFVYSREVIALVFLSFLVQTLLYLAFRENFNLKLIAKNFFPTFFTCSMLGPKARSMPNLELLVGYLLFYVGYFAGFRSNLLKMKTEKLSGDGNLYLRIFLFKGHYVQHVYNGGQLPPNMQIFGTPLPKKPVKIKLKTRIREPQKSVEWKKIGERRSLFLENLKCTLDKVGYFPILPVHIFGV